MALRLRLKDGQIDAVEADSPEELFQYHQLLRNGSRPKLYFHTDDEPLPETAAKLVRLLSSATDGMNSEAVAKALSVDPRGLGGFVTSLSGWGKRRGLSKRQLISKERRPNGDGHLVRKLHLAEPLARLIKEGKVKGL